MESSSTPGLGPFFWRVIAAGLAPLIAAGPLLPPSVQAAVAPPPAVSLPAPQAAPLTTSHGTDGIVPNRQLPEITPPQAPATIPDNPRVEDIRKSGVFSEPLVASRSDVPAAELKELADALRTMQKVDKKGDMAALEKYVEKHPGSPWLLSLLVNFADRYFHEGYFTKALAAWEAAWEAGKNEETAELRNLADRAVAELAALNARLGRRDRLRAVLEEVKGRDIDGSARAWLTHAASGLALMDARPEDAYRCGPMAVANALSALSSGKSFDPRVEQLKSTHDGTSLAQLQSLADGLNLGLKAKKRAPGGPLPLPAVVHWKAGHFAAIVQKIGDTYQVKDPTFVQDFYITREAIDAEASGYFLMPQSDGIPGLTDVATGEAQTVWGKGATATSDPDDCDECDEKRGGNQTNCSGGACKGMAGYSVHALLVSLNIVDTPLSYQPAYGPSVQFTLTYNQQDTRQPANFAYTNFGASWTCDWVSYVTQVTRKTSSLATSLKFMNGAAG